MKNSIRTENDSPPPYLHLPLLRITILLMDRNQREHFWYRISQSQAGVVQWFNTDP